MMLAQLKYSIKTTRFKTTIWYSMLFLALETLIGLILYFQLHSNLTKQLDNSLSRQAEAIYILVSQSKVDMTDFKPDSIYSSTDEFVYNLIYEAVVFNPRNTYVQVQFKNKLIYKTDNLENIKLEFPGINKKKTGITVYKDQRISTLLIRAAYLEKGNYKIIVAYPDKLIEQTLDNFIDIYVILSPIFFIIAVLGGFLISAKALSRIDSIIAKTNEITAQNLNETIEGAEFNDEYGRLVRTMNAMVQRIKTSIDYMNQFSISASHELKTPLTILRGEIEVAMKSAKTVEEFKSVLSSNYEETIRLTKIVDRIFYISKLDNALISIKKETVSWLEFLEETILPLEILGKEKKMKLVLDIDADTEIEIDTELMKEALNNLIDNAIKYGDENQPVIVRSVLVNNQVKLAVINKGTGIPAEEIPKIFDRFYRIEISRSRSTGGVGLGLAIVKSIINWHNGKIEVISELGKETQFIITLEIKK
ncbi:MAG: ATP-binding protein [Ignavibacteriales bacterium]|nr:ATP-binding protein [Ignavibacteriales bacterium]